MLTILTPAATDSVASAAALLQGGQVVAIPTETVYGLAANTQDGVAVGRIFAAKGRPQDNPLIVHIAQMDMLPLVAVDIPPEAYKLGEAFWPGPLTLVLPRAPLVAQEVTCGLSTVAVRMPAHPVAREVIIQSGLPLAAPSANLSGSPSPTTAQHVLADMDGRIPLILDGGPCEVGVESTVLSLAGMPTVLRPGAITPEDIAAVLGKPVALANAVYHPPDEGEAPQSPGTKYRHYAPKADVWLLEGDMPAFTRFLHDLPDKTGVWALCHEGEGESLPVPSLAFGRRGDLPSQAAALFGALRRLDENGAQTVYALAPTKKGMGLAVYDRLLRAAAFKVKKL